jgi:hypothetical protein
MYAAQSELAVELAKIGNILITGYKNQQVRYDPSIKNLSFLNAGCMAKQFAFQLAIFPL